MVASVNSRADPQPPSPSVEVTDTPVNDKAGAVGILLMDSSVNTRNHNVRVRSIGEYTILDRCLQLTVQRSKFQTIGAAVFGSRTCRDFIRRPSYSIQGRTHQVTLLLLLISHY